MSDDISSFVWQVQSKAKRTKVCQALLDSRDASPRFDVTLLTRS